MTDDKKHDANESNGNRLDPDVQEALDNLWGGLASLFEPTEPTGLGSHMECEGWK